MDHKDLCLTCLARLSGFENNWAYYCLSDGGLYPEATREYAGALAEAIRNLALEGTVELSPGFFKLSNANKPEVVVEALEAWSRGDAKAAENLWTKLPAVNAFFSALKGYLYAELGLGEPPSGPDGSEMMYRVSFTRWQGHIPTTFLMGMFRAEDILEQAGSSRTIVVMGDIRRSQDLMTYAEDENSFAKYMVRFVEESRRLIDENLGIFDKFTGDGFLCYFNESVCARLGEDFEECFMRFAKHEMAFARDHFANWCRTVRRLPDAPIGLSLGADLGSVSFRDIDSHFVAVGDPIVWAARMADAGGANETIVNNLLCQRLLDKPGVDISSKPSKTKSGEAFLGWRVEFSDEAGV
ncbi:MAG: hypothetical protein D6E12_07750 [Desulfovibrio sp.]|mgnify:CR=1 FL=1|nr:MAG: hypothetical protein D6E12_07750 [Desulfovibrio sp.]